MILFRTNGGKNSGLGHIMRCLSLARALFKSYPEKTIIFRTNEEMHDLVIENGYTFQSSQRYDKQDAECIRKQKPEMIIFDSYLANTDYLKKIKQNTFLVQFDDNNDRYTPVVANVVINGNIHAPSLHYNVEADYYQPVEKHHDTYKKFETPALLLGPKYLVMREEYQDIIEEKEGNGVMITTGGSDFLNLMPLFIKSLKDTEYKKTIIIGQAFVEEEIQEIKRLTDGNQMFKLIYKPKSLKKHILDSEIVITAAASTVYEVLRLKKIPVIYTLADNQKKIEMALKERHVVSLGDYKEIAFEKKFMIEKIEEAKKRENNILDLYDIIDGKGVFRIVDEVNIFTP